MKRFVSVFVVVASAAGLGALLFAAVIWYNSEDRTAARQQAALVQLARAQAARQRVNVLMAERECLLPEASYAQAQRDAQRAVSSLRPVDFPAMSAPSVQFSTRMTGIAECTVVIGGLFEFDSVGDRARRYYIASYRVTLTPRSEYIVQAIEPLALRSTPP